ncbi:hypothetical protein CL653_01325 [bacterium]|nr:hypothetical protein [bacterium]
MNQGTGDNWTNENEKANQSLEQAIEDSLVAENSISEDSIETVEKAVTDNPLLEVDAGRTRSRVLFVTNEENIATVNSLEHSYYLALAKVFDEVHIILPLQSRGKEKIVRLTDNVWVYSICSPYLFLLKRKALQIVKDNLTFNGVVRPDLVVSRDPFLSGAVGRFVAKKIQRPWQVHVLVNPFNLLWLQKDKRNIELQRIANKVLKKARSIRTGSETIFNTLKGRYRKDIDIKILPHYYNLNAYKDSAVVFDVHERYSQYKFIMLAEGELTADSALHDVITAARFFMTSPKIGLIVLADGPAKKLFEEKLKILGLTKNVAFVGDKSDLVSFYKTADLFIEAGISPVSEEHILRAVGAELPIVAYQTDIRSDLFVEGDSAFLCEPHDSYCLTKKINNFLNNPALRTRFRKRSRNITSDRIHEDETTYYQALAQSIEAVLVKDDS